MLAAGGGSPAVFRGEIVSLRTREGFDVTERR
jgi:hypothetical protein